MILSSLALESLLGKFTAISVLLTVVSIGFRKLKISAGIYLLLGQGLV